VTTGESGDGRGADDTGATRTGMLAADLPTGAMLAGRFRIDGLLGIGGMGVVYRAFDVALGIPVAVKLLRSELADRPGAFERFRQELLLARQVSSPHVVRIHDIARHEDRWLISMDLVEGEPLDKRLDARGPLPVDEAVDIARQIALGLSAAHARGVIHRDLKPSNILVAADGTAYISDFGIARSLGTRGLTQTGSVVGTPEYLSPEQARAEALDGRSDLYALGLLLYEMLSGQPAFSGGTQSESLAQRQVGPPPGIRSQRADAPAWVERLLDRLLRANPAHRLQTADAVVAAIDRREVPRDFRPGRKSGLALAALVAIAAIGFFALRTPEAPIPTQATPQRMLVLPIENASGNPALADSVLALDDSLRRQLAVDTELPVVDGDRVWQAIAQLGLPDARGTDIETTALLREVPASRVLRPRLSRAGTAFRLEASLLEPGKDPRKLAGKASPDLLAAARDFGRVAASQLSNRPAKAATLWPASQGALQAHGQGLQLRRQGLMEAATTRFTTATALDPGYGLAWLAQAQSALQSGRAELAGEAAERGLAKGSRALRPDFQAVQALAGDDPAPAVAAQDAYVQSHPDDLDGRLRLALLQGQAEALAPAIANLRALIARDDKDPRVWFLLGKYSIMQGNIRDAVDEHLVRALVLYKRGRNPFGEAETVNALGVAYSRLGQTDDAAEQFAKAVELRRGLDDRRGVASSLRNLAQLAIVQGRFDQAQAQLDEARALFTTLGDADGLGAVENELGLLAEERGDFVAAEAAFRRMLRSREQAGDQFGIAESLNNIGFTQFALGDYDSANAFWQQALAAFTRLQDPDGVVRIQQNLGTLELARGRWAESRRLLDSSLATAERQQMVEETAVSRFHLAQLEHAQGRLGHALDMLGRARTLFAERKDQRGLIDTGLARARVLLDANAPADARKELDSLDGKTPSAEQQAALALLRAELADRAGDAAGAARLLASARAPAQASGMQALKLRVDIAGNADNDLDEATRRLGNLSVRLEWLRASLLRQLASGDAVAAASTYELAQRALKGHEDSVHAAALHALGAQALRRAGDATGASAAQARASTAVGRMRQELPAALGAGFDTYPPLPEPTDAR
jgi:tetratricopeptide (TPR) repeat protein